MMIKKIILPLLAGSAILATIILTAANIYLGELNQDEGWYLYAARLTAEGQMPYRDFAFTQGPTMPLIYAVFNPLIEKHGLLAGRWITAMLGLAAAAAGVLLAMRLAPERLRATAGLLALILAGVNVYQCYFCAVVKTYALAGFFLTMGFLALTEGLLHRRTWLLPVAGAGIVLAAGARTSAAIALPIVALLLLSLRRQQPRAAWLLFGGGAFFAAAILFVPFMAQAPEAFLFFAVKFHTMRQAGAGMAAQLIYKAGFISRLIQAYFVPAMLLLVLIMIRRPHFQSPQKENALPTNPASACLGKCIWLTIIAVSLLHLLAPFPYDDYQVFLFPLSAAAIAAMAVRQLGDIAPIRLPAIMLAATICAALSSPINQDWFIRGRDRIWWRFKEETSLQKLRQTAQLIRNVSKPDDHLLTQDTYLAVETGLRVPHGMEMGQFCYFPSLNDEAAVRLNVLNRNGFEQLLRTTPATVAALSGYAFAISAPEIQPTSPQENNAFRQIIDERYAPWKQVGHFGQANTTLELFRLTDGLQKKLVSRRHQH